jgi:hypothetical protein
VQWLKHVNTLTMPTRHRLLPAALLLLVLLFTTTANAIAVSRFPTLPLFSYQISASPNCWYTHLTAFTASSLLFRLHNATTSYEYAKAFCESVGGDLVDVFGSNYADSVWSGLMRDDATQGPYVLSGAPVAPGNTFNTLTPFTDGMLCHDGAGDVFNCTDTEEKKTAMCQRKVFPALYEWRKWPTGPSPVLAATILAFPMTQATAITACSAISADLGYITDAALVDSLLANSLHVDPGFIRSPSTMTACADNVNTGLWTSRSSGAYANQAQYTAAGAPVSTLTPGSSGATVLLGRKDDLTYDFTVPPVTATLAYGVVCTRKLASIVVSLTKTSYPIGGASPPQLTLTANLTWSRTCTLSSRAVPRESRSRPSGSRP